jgi:hypothetical protein
MEYNMRTDSYVMTAHTECAGDMLEIETIRKSIKAINKMAKQEDQMNLYRYNTGWSDELPKKSPQYRVSLMPRGPRRAAAIADGRHKTAYDSCLPIRHAKTIDVYVHRKSSWYY